MTIQIRPMREDERVFVRNSWLKSFTSFHRDEFREKMVCHAARSRNVSPSHVEDLHGRLIDHLIDRQQVSVAHAEGEPDVILGWACHGVRQDGKPLVHYVYVKQSARLPELNICLTLLAFATKGERWIATHSTPAFNVDRIRGSGGWLDEYSIFV